MQVISFYCNYLPKWKSLVNLTFYNTNSLMVEIPLNTFMYLENICFYQRTDRQEKHFILNITTHLHFENFKKINDTSKVHQVYNIYQYIFTNLLHTKNSVPFRHILKIFLSILIILCSSTSCTIQYSILYTAVSDINDITEFSSITFFYFKLLKLMASYYHWLYSFK